MTDRPNVIGYQLTNRKQGSTLCVLFDPNHPRVKRGDCVKASGISEVRAKSGDYCKDKTIASLQKYGRDMAKTHKVPFTEKTI